VSSASQHYFERARRMEARRNPPPVKVHHVCPICRGAHSRLEHPAPGCAGLNADQLRELHRAALAELTSAVRRGAEPDHVAGVVRVLDVTEAKLAAMPQEASPA
jgi:hypothetical protein